VYSIAEQLGRLAGFLLLPLTTGKLGESQFGLRELIATSIALGAQLAGINIAAAMARFYFEAKDPARRNVVLSTAVLAVLGSAALFACAALVVSLFLAGRSASGNSLALLIQLAAAIFVFQILRDVQNRVLQVQERSVLFAVLSLSKLLVEIALQIVTLVHFRAGLAGLLVAIAASEASFALLTSAILLPRIGLSFSRGTFRELLRYALPLVPNGVLQFCLHSSDRYFVGAICGSSTLGLYALGYRLGYIPNYLVLGPFLLIWYPFVFSLADDGVRKQLIARLAPLVMLVMSAATLGVALFARELVGVAAGRESFHAAVIVVPLVALSYWLWGLFQIVQTGFYVVKQTTPLPRLTAGAVAVNTFLNIALIPSTGLIGAALATVVTFGVLAYVAVVKVAPVFAVDYAWRRILAPLALALAAMIAAELWNARSTALARWVAPSACFLSWGLAAAFAASTQAERRAALATLFDRGRRGRAEPG
jgi:O-antigen/teichoic acid export membrane protein